MNAAKADFGSVLLDIAAIAGGAIVGEMVKPQVVKVTKSDKVTNVLMFGAGIAGALFIPQRLGAKFAAGVAVNGGLSLAAPVLRGAGVNVPTLNGARRLSPDEHRAIVAKLKQASKAYRMNGDVQVLNGAMGGDVPVLNGTPTYDGASMVW